MPPPRADVWKPPPESSYSKEAVNRAGELLRDYFHTPIPSGKDVWDLWDPAKVVEAFYAVTWWKQLHARPLSKVGANLRYHVMKESGEIDGKIDVAQRLKKRDTIIDKLNRYPKMKLTRMHDIGGVRARLPSVECVQAVSRRLRKTWTVVNTRDYLAEAKSSGYRAMHHDVRRDGRVIEVQLRTARQDAWANQVEDDSRALDTGYKFGFGDEDIHAYYRTISDIFWCMDTDQPIPEELAEEARVRYAKIRDVLRPQARRGQ
jgi:putative GTP pyrophosphokinase